MNHIKKFTSFVIILTGVCLIFLACGRDSITGEDIVDRGYKAAFDTDNDFPSADTITGPYLYIPEPEFDFGYTFQYSKISHKFRLYSAGDDTLRILKVRPG